MSNERSSEVTSESRGILLVVSSPSGAGKTTLCRRLLAEFDRIDYSISYTTRPPRYNERDGVDYHFIDEARFHEMNAQGMFAEWAVVHGHHYGTSKATVEQSLARGRDLLFDIDWQGAVQLQREYPEETVMIFVLPPSMRELALRLRNRGTDANEEVARRLAKAAEELGHYDEYHYLMQNDDLQRAYDDLRAIYRSAHLYRQRQAFRVQRLLEEIRDDV